jgi:hypothetical protein
VQLRGARQPGQRGRVVFHISPAAGWPSLYVSSSCDTSCPGWGADFARINPSGPVPDPSSGKRYPCPGNVTRCTSGTVPGPCPGKRHPSPVPVPGAHNRARVFSKSERTPGNPGNFRPFRPVKSASTTNPDPSPGPGSVANPSPSRANVARARGVPQDVPGPVTRAGRHPVHRSSCRTSPGPVPGSNLARVTVAPWHVLQSPQDVTGPGYVHRVQKETRGRHRAPYGAPCNVPGLDP